MNHVYKYYQFIKEAEEESAQIEPSNFEDIKEEITELIKSSIKTEGDKTFNDFIEDFIKNPEEVQIEGLINDSDIYEFYLKWRTDVDDILSQINFYDEIPSDIRVFSLYDYIIKGTKKSIEEVISMLK